jgi:hypothetical protein
MRDAFEYLRDNYPTYLKNEPLEQIQQMIIHLMVGYQMARAISWGHKIDPISEMKRYYDYFKPISISEDEAAIHEDHNYGACSIDLNEGHNFGYVWTH